ncbi:MAG: TIGR00282 family metallophosphoesterase [Rhodospirillales bacterium]
MRVMMLGDVVGRSGREAVCDEVPGLRDRFGLDFVVVNGENAAHGFGINEKICNQLYDAGVDCITTGNHIWDQREVIGYIDSDVRLLRPGNFPAGTPGRGGSVYVTPAGQRIAVFNVMCRLFMDPLDDPFAWLAGQLEVLALGDHVDAILVDVHGEATSEKQAMANFIDGHVSLVIGTHVHVPTADARILPNGTAYQTDLGMCGDYESVIGMNKQPAIDRFVRKVPGERLSPAEGPATICGVVADIDDRTGLATGIEPIRLGGILRQAMPGG